MTERAPQASAFSPRFRRPATQADSVRRALVLNVLLDDRQWRPATPLQRVELERTAGAVRFIWNSALALQKHRLERHAYILNYAQLCKELTAARNNPELAFLNKVHNKPQEQVLKDLGRAFADFFSGSKGFPRFKKKGRQDRFRHPERIVVEGKHVSIPG